MALPTFQAVGSSASSVGAISPPWPTHQADDIGLLVIETSNQGAVTLSDAQGFAAVTNSPQGVGTPGVGSETQLTVFWARASSGAMAAPTVADLGNHQLGEIMTVRGCITTGNPWDVTAGDVQSTATTAVSVPGATTTVPNCLVVMIASNGFDTDIAQTSGWANPDLANVTERGDINTALGHGGGFGYATGEKAAAGAYGATMATLAGASQQGRLSIALRPPVASSTTSPWVEPMEAEGDWVDSRWVRPFDVL